ncbi:MAG: anti-sigma factor [Sphingomicrobium sp.]
MDDDRFFAWFDGELAPAEAAEVAAAVARDPELAARAEAHRAIQARLGAAFDPLVAAPLPGRIGETPTDFAAARDRRATRHGGAGGIPQWAAMAATLVLGLGLGAVVASREASDAPMAIEGGRMVAAASLDRALDHQLASAQGGGGVRVGLTFRTTDGTLCRSFSGVGGASGLACRSGDAWQLRGLFGGGAASGGDYRMAAGEDPRLAELIDQSIAGEPFDAAAEKAALARGWR